MLQKNYNFHSFKSADYEERLDDTNKKLEKSLSIKRSNIKRNEKLFKQKQLEELNFMNEEDNNENLNNEAITIRSSITNELSFSKELKVLLKKNVNRDYILNTEFNMLKDQYNELFENSARRNAAETDESIDRNIILSKFRKAVRKVFIVQK
jgi:hypothetical protein